MRWNDRNATFRCVIATICCGLAPASCGGGGEDQALSRVGSPVLGGRLRVVYANDFDDPATVGPEWTRRATAVTPNGARRFLGEFSGNTTSLSLGLPDHQQLIVEFDLLVLKSWDGSSPVFGPDRWRLLVEGGPTLLDTTFSNQPTPTDGAANDLQAFGGVGAPPGLYRAFTGAAQVNTLGYFVTRKSTGEVVPEDAVYHFRFVIDHTAPAVKLVFSGIGLQGVPDESWGLDNVVVSVDSPRGANIVAAGIGHTCVLLNDGSVKCWGLGVFGQLGYPGRTLVGDDETPAAVGAVDVGGSAVQLAAGGFHTCAVLQGGAVRCWGLGRDGQLGYGNRENVGDDEVPAAAGDVDVGAAVDDPSFFQVDNIALGDFHTCVHTIELDRLAVRCWGRNSSGQLGYGNTRNIGDDEPPAAAGFVQVVTGLNVQGIAAGGEHTCATSDSQVLFGSCWGLGSFGQLGYGNTRSIGDDELANAGGILALRDPAAGGFFLPIRQFAAGRFHTCALAFDAGRTVRCWGNNQRGQLGYANTNDIGDDETLQDLPAIDVGGPVTQIAAGAFHTCALLDTGAVRCWGQGSSGQLGYGNTNDVGDDETPASAGDVPLGGRAVFIDAGESHTCAVLDTTAVRCWGDNAFGQLGYGNTASIGDDETPASAGDVPLF